MISFATRFFVFEKIRRMKGDWHSQTAHLCSRKYLIPCLQTCQALAMEYMDTGSQVIVQYGRNYVDYVDHNTINQSYCFDDLGADDEVKHYGTSQTSLARAS